MILGILFVKCLTGWLIECTNHEMLREMLTAAPQTIVLTVVNQLPSNVYKKIPTSNFTAILGIGTRFAPPQRPENEKSGHAAPKNDVTALRERIYSRALQSAHFPQFASSFLHSPSDAPALSGRQSEHPLPLPPLASGSEQSVHPPWEADAGVAFVAVPLPALRSSTIPS